MKDFKIIFEEAFSYAYESLQVKIYCFKKIFVTFVVKIETSPNSSHFMELQYF